MTALAWLIPAALVLGLLGLAAFLWALRSGQFEDLEGASWRAIQDSEHPDASDAPRRAEDKDTPSAD
jgi:cbb3-type cytochrome oxidase maturation protein